MILKNIVTRFLNNFRIYGTPPSPGVYNDTNVWAQNNGLTRPYVNIGLHKHFVIGISDQRESSLSRFSSRQLVVREGVVAEMCLKNSRNFCKNFQQKFCTRQGKKRVYTTTVAPLLSRSVARPRGHRAKKAIVYTIFLEKQGKRVYTIGPERRVYSIEPQTPKKKGGFLRWWCIHFSSVPDAVKRILLNFQEFSAKETFANDPT